MSDVIITDGATVRVKAPGMPEGTFDRVLLVRGDEVPENLADGEADRLKASGALGSTDDLEAAKFVAQLRGTNPTAAAEAERQVREDGVSYADALKAVTADQRPAFPTALPDPGAPVPETDEDAPAKAAARKAAATKK